MQNMFRKRAQRSYRCCGWSSELSARPQSVGKRLERLERRLRARRPARTGHDAAIGCDTRRTASAASCGRVPGSFIKMKGTSECNDLQARKCATKRCTCPIKVRQGTGKAVFSSCSASGGAAGVKVGTHGGLGKLQFARTDYFLPNVSAGDRLVGSAYLSGYNGRLNCSLCCWIFIIFRTFFLNSGHAKCI